MKNIVIIGATSAIAQEVARIYAKRAANFYLVGRSGEKLSAIEKDLSVLGASEVNIKTLDLNRVQEHATLVSDIQNKLKTVDLVLVAHGTLPEQEAIQDDYQAVFEALQSNALSTLSLLTEFAPMMEKQRHGTLAVISSVAGDRGRQSNYIYGTAKAAVTTYCEGLRNRLTKAGAHVLTIKPGFVDTPMTASFDKGGPLWAQPQDVAKDIVNAVDKGKNTLYTPYFWRLIMLIIRHIPEFIFKKLSL